jgi:hypothetical protein
VLWMAQNTRLEDGRQICRGHLVQIGFAREDGQQVQNVQQELAIEWRQLSHELLVHCNRCLLIEMAHARTLRFYLTHGLRLVVPQWISKALVEAQRDYRFWQLIKVPPENIRRIVHCETSPVEAFAISIWRVELDL